MRKSIIWVMGIGGSIGCILACWLAPKFIAWYFEPPVEIGVSCRASIQSAMLKLQWSQVVGIVGGALTGLLIYMAFRRRRPSTPAAIEPTR
jgi:hypothetical protein